jgi:UDP-N-acetylmuramoyl-tripeptide--D-alanyl-D-alanine ligase
MTYAVLSKAFKTVATQGNLNNEIGVPITLLNIEENTQIAVVEMGADKKGDIAFLCHIAKPDRGVITNIGTAHIQSFGSVETIAQTKCELFEALSNDGIRFVNLDDERLRPHANTTKGLVTFGFNNAANYRGEIISINETACVKIRVLPPEGSAFDIQLKVPGIHQANNALIAAAVGHSLGVGDGDIVSAMENYIQPSNRLGIRRHNNITIIDDTYNANPESMRAAIDTLIHMKHGGRAIAVMSDMLELGPVSEREHFFLGEYIEKKSPTLFLRPELNLE